MYRLFFNLILVFSYFGFFIFRIGDVGRFTFCGVWSLDNVGVFFEKKINVCIRNDFYGFERGLGRKIEVEVFLFFGKFSFGFCFFLKFFLGFCLGFYFIVKRSEVLMSVITWVKFEKLCYVKEVSYKVVYCMISFVLNVYNR